MSHFRSGGVPRLQTYCVLVAVAALSAAAPPTEAQTLTTVYSFSGSDGSAPSGPLVLAGDGNLYGTTYGGGAYQLGTIFRLTPGSALTTVYSFSGSTHGSAPSGALSPDGNGNLYGTTYSGGSNNAGTVFKFNPAGSLVTLHSFNTTDGAHPVGGLLGDAAGNVYGTTSAGGLNKLGTVFAISATGAFTTLYSFSGTDGSAPYSALVLGMDGNLYGTTDMGGANNYYGTIFQLTPGGVLTTIYSFGFMDGSNPYGSLTAAPDGSFFGATFNGGQNSRYGTLFNVTSCGMLTTLRNFSGTDGSGPESALLLAGDGNYYGTSVAGGSYSNGTIFQLSPAGVFTTLHSFTRPDGVNPTAALTVGFDGNLFGTTAGGGANGYGTVFKLVVCPFCTTTSVSSSANPSAYGSSVTFTATVTPAGAPGGSVVFTDNGDALGTAPLVNGAASVTTSSLGSGQHTIRASYAGDGTFGSSAGTVSESVNQATSTLSLASDDNPATVNQTVNFTATVSSPTGGIPTGAISFAANGSSIGSPVPLVSGQASIGTTFAITGTDIITATYSGDGNFLAASSSLAQTVSPAGGTISLTDLYSFGGLDGSSPASALVLGNDGNFYGTTQTGGANSAGSIFQFTPVGALSTSYSFGGPDGASPLSLTLGRDGTLYGVTSGGGTGGNGTVFSIVPGGSFTNLYKFTGGTDGSSPTASLILGPDGNLYGTTSTGGTSGGGTVFQITPAGSLTTLHSFSGADGANPSAALTLSGSNVFYGVTQSGGLNSDGTVFQISTSGAFHSLASFSDADGSAPSGALTPGGDGNFYGVTATGGSNGNGTVFKMDTAGHLSTLYNFSGADGSGSKATLVLGSDGSFYGSTNTGGANPLYGTLFKMTPAGALTSLHSFAGSDGANPAAAITFGPDRNLYGTTAAGGASGNGTIFKLNTCPGCTGTSLSSTANPSSYGAALTLAAAVAGGFGSPVPTGTVTFLDSGSTIGSAQLISGTAAISLSTLSVGGHSLTAQYGGDGNYQASTAALVQVVNMAGTTTMVASGANPSTYNQAVTFTASVLPAVGTGTPSGTVTFTDGSTSLGTFTLSGGSVSTSPGALNVGSHTITATYNGSTSFQTSLGTISQVVNRAATTASVVSSLNPATSGKSVTFTATLTSAAGTNTTGTTTFYQNGTQIGSPVSLSSGKASVSTSFAASGMFSITATYSGDSNFLGSTSPILSEVVTASSTTTSTTLRSSANPAFVTKPVTFTATVKPATGSVPNGESVTFYNGSAVLGSGLTNAGIATYTTSTLAYGTYSIKAVYSGDSKYLTSTSAVLSQTISRNTTTIALASNLNPASYGNSITFTATVSSAGPAPTGTVTFKNGSTAIGTGTLSGGIANLTTSGLSAGSNSITATYGGDANSGASASAALTEAVSAAATTTVVTSSKNPSTKGTSVTFTATVSATGTTVKSTGNITFKSGSLNLGTFALNAGRASVSTAALPSGSDVVTASYGGSTNFSASTGSMTQTVK